MLEKAASLGDVALHASTPTLQAGKLGIYVLQDGGRTLVNGRPFYKLDDSGSTAFLYHYKNGHWKVGKDTGDANCWLNARDSAMTPDLITAQWRVRDGTAKSWEDTLSVGITSRGEYGNEHAMQQQ